MFVVYIKYKNSASTGLQCKVHMYTDDSTVLLFRANKAHESKDDIQRGLRMAAKLFIQKKLDMLDPSNHIFFRFCMWETVFPNRNYS